MATVLIVIHLMIVVAMIAVILLQRSDGGALGIGGGSFMSRRGAGNALTRATSFLAVTFFATSLALALLAKFDSRPADVLERLGGSSAPQSTEPLPPLPTQPDGEGPGVLDALRGDQQPSVPRE